jgi:hypothetical protein
MVCIKERLYICPNKYNKHNSMYQDIKRKFTCAYLTEPGHSCKALIFLLLGLLEENPTWEMQSLLMSALIKKKEGFFAFFNIVITSVCGNRSWTNNIKLSQTISAWGKVTISDKAYAEILIKN